MGLGRPSVWPDGIFLNLREDSNSTQVGIISMSPDSFYAFQEGQIAKLLWDFAKIP